MIFAQVCPSGSFFDRRRAAAAPRVPPCYFSSRSDDMRRFLRAGGFGLVGLALLATPAVVWGFRIRVVTPIPERVALADVIVIGKVASIGKKPVMVKESGLNREVAYSVAVFE